MKQRLLIGLIICFLLLMPAVCGEWDVFAQSPTPYETIQPDDLIIPNGVKPSQTPYEPAASPSESSVETPIETPIEKPSPTPSASPAAGKFQRPLLSPEEESSRKANREALAKQIDNYVKNAAGWKNSQVGIYVSVVETGDMVFSKSGNLPMTPASNLKIFTTAAALNYLGPDFKFETTLWGDFSEKAAGEINSSLYLRGTGDPTFMEPYIDYPEEKLEEMVLELKKQGVKVINGDLVADDSAFDREFLGRGWKPRYLLDEYAAPAGALSVNGNTVRLVIESDRSQVLPQNSYIRLSRKASNTGSVYVTRKIGTDDIVIHGHPSGKVYRNITINNPSWVTISTFASLLKKHGIKIAGKVRLVNKSDEGYTRNLQLISRVYSPPLTEILNEINKESDNISAQHLFKAIGYFVKGKGSNDLSNEAVREFIAGAGINPSGFIMADGSGLSEYSRVTPRQFCELLVYMRYHPHWKPFFESMSAAGKDGTLKYRMADLPVNAKTGSLRGYIALSGYVTTKANQLLVFSIITNNHDQSSGTIRWIEDNLVRILAAYAAKL